MKDPVNRRRRDLIIGMLAMPVSGLAAVAESTPPGSEGPFYPTAGMRFADDDNDLVRIAGVVEQAGGEVVELGGRVLDRNGNPVSGARVEIWQCDVKGRYLHRGDSGGGSRDKAFQGFGHDTTGADGRYSFRTIKPVPYPGRTPHIHIAVLPPGEEPFVTQLYIAGEERNDTDFLYNDIPPDKRHLVTAAFKESTIPGSQQQADFDIILNRTDGTPQDS